LKLECVELQFRYYNVRDNGLFRFFSLFLVVFLGIFGHASSL
jgi:hypothetical protein